MIKYGFQKVEVYVYIFLIANIFSSPPKINT